MADSIVQQLQQDVNTINMAYSHIIQNQDNLLTSLFLVSVAIVISIIFISYSAYIRGRDTEKGKIDARLEQLDSLVNEQEKITKTVETIKNDIEKGVWLEKEKNVIKRQKIAEMMSCLSSLHSYFYKVLSDLNNPDGDIDDLENPLSKMLDINALYFEPNEIDGVLQFHGYQAEICSLISEYSTNNLQQFKETQKHLTPDDDFIKRFGETIKKYIEPGAELRVTLGKKMSELLDER